MLKRGRVKAVTKDQVAPDGGGVVTATVADPGKKQKYTYISVGIIAILVVVAGIFLYAKYHHVISVGKYGYTQEQYDQLLSQAKKDGVGKDEARDAIVKGLAARAAADKLDVAYEADRKSQTDAAQAFYDVPFNQTDKITDYQRVTSYPMLVENAVKVAETGGSKVGIVYFPFSRYVVGFFENARLKKLGYDQTLIGNADAVQKDMAYAKEQGEKYRKAYNSGDMSLDEVVSAVLADGRLEHGQIGNKSQVAVVTNEGVVQSVFGSNYLPDDIFATIKSQQKVHEASQLYEEVFSGEGYSVPVPELSRKDGFLAGWYFVVVDEKMKQQSNITERYESLVKEYERV